MIKIKQKLSIFNDVTRIPETLTLFLENIARQLRYGTDDLINLLKKCSDAVSDSDFKEQLLHINKEISEMSLNN